MPLDMSCGCEVTDCAACGGPCSRFAAAAAAFMAVRWKSMVLGVTPPLCRWLKMPACELGLGAGNMDPLPPGVKPVRIEDSLGVGKPPRRCVSLK